MVPPAAVVCRTAMGGVGDSDSADGNVYCAKEKLVNQHAEPLRAQSCHTRYSECPHGYSH